jgi:hypothetical protein
MRPYSNAHLTSVTAPPSDAVLAADARLSGKIMWRLTPIAFRWQSNDEANVHWVTPEQPCTAGGVLECAFPGSEGSGTCSNTDARLKTNVSWRSAPIHSMRRGTSGTLVVCPKCKTLREWQHHSDEQMHGGDLQISAIPTTDYLHHIYGLAESDVALILGRRKNGAQVQPPHGNRGRARRLAKQPFGPTRDP